METKKKQQYIRTPTVLSLQLYTFAVYVSFNSIHRALTPKAHTFAQVLYMLENTFAFYSAQPSNAFHLCFTQ